MGIPTRLGRYRILSRLGRGEMGTVYRAEDPVIGRPLAIKVLRPLPEGDPEALEDRRARFEREMRVAGSFSHPNIVMLHDVGSSEEGTFIVMEHIDGGSLAELMAEQPSLPFDQVAELIEQIAAALDYAHEHGVYHRDVKPANILLTADGRPKVADFGVARLAGYTMTRQGITYGSPAYMSPEQAAGRKVDGKSDQFAMAIIAYQMITGQLPFTGDTLTAVVYQILNNDPVPPELVNPRVAPAATETILKGLSKNPELRYPDCRSFARSLSAGLRSDWNESQSQAAPAAAEAPDPATTPGSALEATVAGSPAGGPGTTSRPGHEAQPATMHLESDGQGSNGLGPVSPGGVEPSHGSGPDAGASGEVAVDAAGPPASAFSTLERMHAGLQTWDPTEPREALTVFLIAFLMVLTATLSLHVGAAPSPRSPVAHEAPAGSPETPEDAEPEPRGPVFPMPVPSDADGQPVADDGVAGAAPVAGFGQAGGLDSSGSTASPASLESSRDGASAAPRSRPVSAGGPGAARDSGSSESVAGTPAGGHENGPPANGPGGAATPRDGDDGAGTPGPDDGSSPGSSGGSGAASGDGDDPTGAGTNDGLSTGEISFDPADAGFDGWYPWAPPLGEKLAERAFESTRLLRTTLDHPEAQIPAEILGAARCVAVIPGVVKVGFLVGGRYGKGLVSCRTGGGWSAPSFVSVKGGSFGLQAGVQSTDFVLVLVGADSPDWMSTGKLKLGGDAAITAGPLARSAEASTALGGNAEVFSYAYTQGLFAGVSLEGATLRADRDAIHDVYGGDSGPGDILRRHGGLLAPELLAFVVLLDGISS